MQVNVSDIARAQDGIVDVADGEPSAAPRRFTIPESVARAVSRLGWTLLSVGLFAGIWELLWYWGIADPKLLPPPNPRNLN